MRWSVVRRGRGRPRDEPRGDRRARRRGRRRTAASPRASAPTSYGAQLVVEAEDRDDARSSWPPAEFVRAAAQAGLPRGRSPRSSAISEDDDELERPRMIRLGSLAGYPFEGPRLLGGWTPPASPAVYAIMYKPDPETKPETYAVIYVGHADDLSAERLPVQPSAGAVLDPAGRQPVEGLHLHLRGAGRAALAPRADRPGARRDLPPELQRAAVRPVVEGRVDRRVHGADHRPAHHRPRPR